MTMWSVFFVLQSKNVKENEKRDHKGSAITTIDTDT